MSKFLIINNNDNVAVAIDKLSSGEFVNINNSEIVIQDDIPFGNKFAINHISHNSNIVKYGYPIGKATEDIVAGALVHTNNVRTNLDSQLTFNYQYDDRTITNDNNDQYFEGYIREDGSVGIRNELWIIPMVGCVNSVVKSLESRAKRELMYDNIDDIVAFTHQFGCSQLGEDHENFQIMLANLAHNPNAASVLFVALGCENNTISSFVKYLGDYDKSRIRFIQCQDLDDEIEEGMMVLSDLAYQASQCQRAKATISKLVVGLKCGGSDGLSGITANPVIGAFTDLLVLNGGSAILTEVPEMFGAEQVLINRCIDNNTYSRFIDMINRFKQYYISHNQPVYENPSPGNKKGGITTLEEKSLGCVLKGGMAIVNNVIDYCSRDIKPCGVNVMSGPGNDLIAATALAASGAQIILFSTGRGTPFATVVPTVKISSNSALYNKKSNWIDFNAGEMLDNGSSVEKYGKKLYHYVMDIANGQYVKSEKDGLKEIAFFKTGVTL